MHRQDDCKELGSEMSESPVFGEPFTWSNPRTFYLSPEKWAKNVTITGDDAHHLLHVLRLGRGDVVRLMDGCGREGEFTIERCDKNSVQCAEVRTMMHARPTSGCIIAPAWTKAARKSWIFEKSVEFGVSEIWFWEAERTQFPMPTEPKDAWYAQMVAGLKQCRIPWLPQIRMIPGGAAGLVEAAKNIDISTKYIMMESTLGKSPILTENDLSVPGNLLCVIGPEGGFEPTEAQTFVNNDFHPFSLGERIFRWETAAVLCMGLRYMQTVV